MANAEKVQNEIPSEDGLERVIQNMKAADFQDWPNEAGFEGLTEVRGPVDLAVQGTIPAWAAGSLYRTGPGQYDVEDTPKGLFRTTHWFDGFSHSHRFQIIADADGPRGGPVRVAYSSRRQAQDYVDAIRRTGRAPNLTFAQRQDPCIGIFAKVMSVWRKELSSGLQTPSSSNICVTVNADVPGLPSAGAVSSSGHRAAAANTLWLATDASSFKEMDPETLEPVGRASQQSLHPDLKGPLSCAHAQRDPETGDLFNFNLEMGRYARYRVFRTSASSGTTDILATICESDLRPAYIHSFFLTRSFAILCVPSTHLGFMGVKVPWVGNVADAIDAFDGPSSRQQRCRWFVVDRRGGRGLVASFASPAGFFFHSVNAFEEQVQQCDDDDGATSDHTDVFCDLVGYPSTDIIRGFDMDVLLQRDGAAAAFWGDDARCRNCMPRYVRYRLRVPSSSSSSGQVRQQEQQAEEVMSIPTPRVGELPTINPAYATRRHRYVYSLPTRGLSTLTDGLVKTDTATGRALLWEGPRGHTPGEAIFVARPDASDEDDGVLLSVVLDGLGRRSYLLCLDARTMTEMGRAECDFAVPLGFHGLHKRA
ncbi:beta,beta-carotene 9',10'-dioxygenase [Xylariaceae sp. FL0804]|nr:beta,beta-carotene 9',10'-dioxygenase [Xylariaceae sp. FL0804]